MSDTLTTTSLVSVLTSYDSLPAETHIRWWVSDSFLGLVNTDIGSFPFLGGVEWLLRGMRYPWESNYFDLLIQSGTCCFRSSVLHAAEKRRNIQLQMAGGERVRVRNPTRDKITAYSSSQLPLRQINHLPAIYGCDCSCSAMWAYVCVLLPGAT